MENEVRQIQLKCLEILRIVDSICRKYEIEYSLCGGSVVGAHLYKGCLPWDDDVDLMMTRDNYNRFIDVVEQELPTGFSAHNFKLTEDYQSLFTKIVNDQTTLVQQDGTVSGVFLDITVYDRVPNNWKSKIDIFLWKVSQVVTIGKIEGNSLKTKCRNFLLSVIPLLRNQTKYLNFFQKCVEALSLSKEYHYSELFGAYCNTKPYAPEIFEHYSEIEFEGESFMIVRDYVRYLETRYDRTDFREPKEKQVAPHFQYVNFDLPYGEYLDHQT